MNTPKKQLTPKERLDNGAWVFVDDIKLTPEQVYRLLDALAPRNDGKSWNQNKE